MKSLSLLLLIPVLLFGCQGNRNRNAVASNDVLGQAGEAGGSSANPSSTISADPILGIASAAKPVYFDYDSVQLRADAITALQDNARILQNTPDTLVQIAGHSDERGTQEYNMALGQRRAETVRDYLVQLGVPANRLALLSYGEEFPAAEGHDEAAWQLNRRCEFNQAK